MAAILAGLIVFIAGSENDSGVSSDDPFAPQYAGLEHRRTAASVPTMAEGGGEHFHPSLEVYVRGEQITVPANIGVHPSEPPELMAGLHTHDTTGTIHNEAGRGQP